MVLRPFGTKTRERRTCPRLSDTRNLSGGHSSIRYEVAQKLCLSLSIWYEDSSKQDFVRLIRSRVKRKLVLVRLVQGFKWERLRPFGTMKREKRACPRPSSTRIQASGTSSIRYKVTRMEGLSLFIQYEGIKHTGLHLSSMKSRKRSAYPRPSSTRNQVGGTSSVRYEDVRKENLSSSVRYEETSRRDFICLAPSRLKGEIVLVHLV